MIIQIRKYSIWSFNFIFVQGEQKFERFTVFVTTHTRCNFNDSLLLSTFSLISEFPLISQNDFLISLEFLLSWAHRSSVSKDEINSSKWLLQSSSLSGTLKFFILSIEHSLALPQFKFANSKTMKMPLRTISKQSQQMTEWSKCDQGKILSRKKTRKKDLPFSFFSFAVEKTLNAECSYMENYDGESLVEWTCGFPKLRQHVLFDVTKPRLKKILKILLLSI